MLVSVVQRLAQRNLVYHIDIDRLSKFQMLQCRDKFRSSENGGQQVTHIRTLVCLMLTLMFIVV